MTEGTKPLNGSQQDASEVMNSYRGPSSGVHFGGETIGMATPVFPSMSSRSSEPGRCIQAAHRLPPVDQSRPDICATVQPKTHLFSQP